MGHVPPLIKMLSVTTNHLVYRKGGVYGCVYYKSSLTFVGTFMTRKMQKNLKFFPTEFVICPFFAKYKCIYLFPNYWYYLFIH